MDAGTGEERHVSRSRCAGHIAEETGQGPDAWQPDEQIAGLIGRIRVRPSGGRTGWTSPTHCANHLEGLMLRYRNRRGAWRRKAARTRQAKPRRPNPSERSAKLPC